MAKAKKLKLMRRVKRGSDRAQEFALNTEDRVRKALKAIANDTYSLSNLADDVLGQWSDFFKVVNQISGGDEDEMGTATFIAGPYNQNNPPPVPGGASLVVLTDTVDGQSIECTDLTGPTTFAKANVRILDPDTDAPPLPNVDLDMVKVKVTALPAQPGTYHGALTLGNTKILGRVLYVYK
ncbi:MAG: hypothetical protein IT294_17215 [Deltaproteobacteria bacterium]|nr:hypothetical protein [Deltaproteobacteria bacterium]